MRSFWLLFFLSTGSLFGANAYAQAKRSGALKPSNKAQLESSQADENFLWTYAFDFLLSEGDTEEIEVFVNLALEKRPEDAQLVARFSSYYLEEKNRRRLIDLFKALAKSHFCQSPPHKAAIEICKEYQKQWTKNLDSVFFFEDSAVKLEKARRLIEGQKECASALPILNDVEAREGRLRNVIELGIEAYSCLKDKKSLRAEKKRLMAIDFFKAPDED